MIESSLHGRATSSADDLSWPDVLACERTVLRFTAAFDAGDIEGMVAAFTVDGVWQRQEGVVTGHDGLRTLMSHRPAGLFVRHVITNMRVASAGPGEASCTSYLTVYRHDDGGPKPVPLRQPALVGMYHDALRKQGNVWQLCGRSVTVEFKLF